MKSRFSFMFGLTLAVGVGLALIFIRVVLAQPGNPNPLPPPNSHDVPVTTSVSITYDEQISPTSVTSHTFAVFGMQSGLVTATHGVVGSGYTVIVTPTNPFHPGELVQASATRHTLNLTGTGPITPTVWQFRTAATGGSGFFVSGNNFGPDNNDTSDLALGDVDGDGDLDVAVGDDGVQNVVYLNNGDGTFALIGNPFGPSNDSTYEIALGDLDGDGDLDVAVGNHNEQNVVYLNNGDGTFTSTGNNFGSDDSATYSVVLGDVDGDGDLDAVVGNFYSQNTVHMNNGDGTFDQSSGIGPSNSPTRNLALGDLDGDGDLDVVVGNDGQNVAYLNDGYGSFHPIGNAFGPTAGATRKVALGDVDGDGDLDVAVGNDGGQNAVYLNNGDGTFASSGNNFGTGVDGTHDLTLGDVDGDGDLDVAVGNDGQNVVYLNNGDGTFAATGNNFGTGGDETYALALGDADGDGDLDVAVGNGVTHGGQNVLYRNRYLADPSIVKTVMPLVAQQGDAITYTLTFSNAGILTATGVVITDVIPTEITGLSFVSSGATITDTGTTPSYVWNVEELSPGEGGVITITGALVTPLTAGDVPNTAFIATVSVGDNEANNSSTATITVANLPPESSAGTDQNVITQSTVTLDGSASSDPNGDPLTYLWTQTGGPSVTLSDPTVVNPTFTAPSDPAVLTFTLTVTDSWGLPDPTPDEVVITVVSGYDVYLPLVVR